MVENAMNLRSTVGDFIQVFEQNMPRCGTRKAAYEAAENLHQKITGSRRYSDYESFRKVRERRIHKKKK